MKKVFLISIFSFIAFFVSPKTAFGNCQGNWEMFPNQTRPSSYFWEADDVITKGSTSHIAPTIGIDSNGYQYWGTANYWNNVLIPLITHQSLGLNSEGYKLWSISNYGMYSTFYYYVGDNRIDHQKTIVNTFSVDGVDLSLVKMDGVNDASIQNVIFSNSYGGRIYFIYYTDDDLSYIDTQTELYNFLDSLNLVSCSYGAEGSWEYPTSEKYDFVNKDFGLLGNMFRDVIVWGFIPKETTLQNFSNLKSIVETKAPFSYFYSVKNALSGLSATSTPAFVLADTGGINTDIFQPLKTGLAWILWIFFAFWVIRRIGNFVP